MKIDKKKALAILEEEAVLAKTAAQDEVWAKVFSEIFEALNGKGQTLVAVLGTALLAKATDLRVDVFSLDIGDNEDEDDRKYSARNLCKDVLAAHAPRLGINLGVSGREPLNNRPYIGKLNIYEAQGKVSKGVLDAMRFLIEFLKVLDGVDDDRVARGALRSFIQMRSFERPALPPLSFDAKNISRCGLLLHIEKFLEKGSEHGKRAQSVVAGLLDAQDSEERVRITKVHDPDRNFPGDVILRGNTDEPWIAFEVRDKPVSAADLDHFAAKCKTHHIVRATIVACVRSPNPDEFNEARLRAESNGVFLSLYGSWRALLDDVLMWSYHPQDVILSTAVTRILARAAELEVSAAGLQLWASGQ